jgi:hypothetical protein
LFQILLQIYFFEHGFYCLEIMAVGLAIKLIVFIIWIGKEFAGFEKGSGEFEGANVFLADSYGRLLKSMGFYILVQNPVNTGADNI